MYFVFFILIDSTSYLKLHYELSELLNFTECKKYCHLWMFLKNACKSIYTKILLSAYICIISFNDILRPIYEKYKWEFL